MPIHSMIRASILAGLVMLSFPLAAQAPDEAQMRQMMEQLKKQAGGSAGPGTAMSEGQMQMMMEQAAKMQTCMAGIDQARLQTMGAESEAVMSEIKGLCAAGQRDAAQDHAMDFGQRVAASAEMKKLADCSAGMRGMLPSMARLAQTMPDNNTHVCDQP